MFVVGFFSLECMIGRLWPALLVFLMLNLQAAEPVGKVYKVLPHLLDQDGLDAYQAFLRNHPESVSGVRFDIQWKARKLLSEKAQVILEIRTRQSGSMKPVVLSEDVKPGFFRRWSKITFSGQSYQKNGPVTAWRVSLWDGELLLDEQKSFLW